VTRRDHSKVPLEMGPLVDERVYTHTQRFSDRSACLCGPERRDKFPVVISRRPHPIPSRTRKLSSLEPMVLLGRPSGRVGRRRDFFRARTARCGPFFFPWRLAAGSSAAWRGPDSRLTLGRAQPDARTGHKPRGARPGTSGVTLDRHKRA
jgi:hypothetical protein